jgi:hypothetical protein
VATSHRLEREVAAYLAATTPDEPSESSESSEPAKQKPTRPRTLTKAIIDRAVEAMQVYLGSYGRARPRDEERLRIRVHRAIERVVAKAQGLLDYDNAYRQVKEEALRRGTRLALLGKDL